jgi:Uma2 family endonuclease
MTRASTRPSAETLGDLLQQLGDISPHRIRLHPPPGKATERDLIRLNTHTDRIYELVDGVLVEKVMGFPESTLTCDLIKLLGYFLDGHDLGFLAGPDGAARLMPGLVRIPDISFISWRQLPARVRPTDPIAGLVPLLAVEVLSKGNRPKEMQRKLKDYFLSGVLVVWFVDPLRRTVEVFTAPDQSVVLTEEDTLHGGDVLPGFALPLRQLFAQMPPTAARPSRGKGSRRSAKKPRRSNGTS